MRGARRCSWFVLAPPDDVGPSPKVATSLDAVEARAKLPAWLQTIRTIEKESGSDAKGPALVATLTGYRAHPALTNLVAYAVYWAVVWLLMKRASRRPAVVAGRAA